MAGGSQANQCPDHDGGSLEPKCASGGQFSSSQRDAGARGLSAQVGPHMHFVRSGRKRHLKRRVEGVERMVADMAAQLQANINAVQAGAAARQVRWGVHGAWHGISCLQT